ncbi:sugar transporter [Colletotrichum graminicola]|nr:sugar transporter [Colletotrichum graminicola]
MSNRLLKKDSRNRIGVGLLLVAYQNLTGANIITYDTKFFATGLYSIAKTLGMVIYSVLLARKVGRPNGLIGSPPMWYIGGYVFRVRIIPPRLSSPFEQLVTDSLFLLARPPQATSTVTQGVHRDAMRVSLRLVSTGPPGEILFFHYRLDILIMCVVITTTNQWLWRFVASRTTPFMITSLR